MTMNRDLVPKGALQDKDCLQYLEDCYQDVLDKGQSFSDDEEISKYLMDTYKKYLDIQGLGTGGYADAHVGVATLMSKNGKTYDMDIEQGLQMLMYKRCFWASVASGMSRRQVPEEICDTLAVVVSPDRAIGAELIYCADYFKNIKSLEHFMFVLEHELVHLVLQHPQRFWEHQTFQTMHGKQIFNIAADYADNSLITRHYKQHEELLRENYLYPEKQGLPAGQSFEQYLKALYDPKYEKQLEELAKQLVNGHMWDKKLDENGNVQPASAGDMSQAAQKNKTNFGEFIKNIADKHEKNYGPIGSEVKELLKDILKPERPPSWDELLKAEVMTGAPVFRDHSPMRFSRRKYGIPGDFAKIPGHKTDRGYTIAFIQDTSGSISHNDLRLAAGIVSDLLDFHQTWELYYVQADTSVKFYRKITDISDFEFTAHGRGGTDFVQPLEWVDKEINPDICIYFTDGWGNAPLKSPNFKVIWCLPRGCKAPCKWGTAIEVV